MCVLRENILSPCITVMSSASKLACNSNVGQSSCSGDKIQMIIGNIQSMLLKNRGANMYNLVKIPTLSLSDFLISHDLLPH